VICPGHLGPQALADAVAALDVGLAPYPPDAPPWFCPLKILDYRAQGTPVVASDLGDVRALVERGGSVVPAGDDDAFVEAVRSWIGRRVRPAVRSWEQVAGELLTAVAEPAQAAAS
jgi:glycosyltransferase involved in cell wall biosynthesis